MLLRYAIISGCLLLVAFAACTPHCVVDVVETRPAPDTTSKPDTTHHPDTTKVPPIDSTIHLPKAFSTFTFQDSVYDPNHGSTVSTRTENVLLSGVPFNNMTNVVVLNPTARLYAPATYTEIDSFISGPRQGQTEVNHMWSAGGPAMYTVSQGGDLMMPGHRLVRNQINGAGNNVHSDTLWTWYTWPTRTHTVHTYIDEAFQMTGDSIYWAEPENIIVGKDTLWCEHAICLRHTYSLPKEQPRMFIEIYFSPKIGVPVLINHYTPDDILKLNFWTTGTKRLTSYVLK
jgi:hypothetical protein